MNRDAKRFAAWVKTHRAFLTRAAWALTGDKAAAQDLVQDTFVLAWRHRAALRDEGAVQAWLYRILRREAVRHWEKRPPWDEWREELAETAACAAESEDLRIDLLRALQALSEPHREILVLFYLSDMSYEELANSLDIAPGTVMSRLNRARAALKALLGED